MDVEPRDNRLRDFLLGGVVGAAAAIAAMWRKQPPPERRRPSTGLAAFEGAPCYRETLERESARSR